VVTWKLPYNVPHQYRILEQEMDPGADAARLDDAPIVIGIGMGLGQDHVSLAMRLADCYGAAIGATRRVVDAGWLPRQHQIGLTGKFVAPGVYLGLGVSGRYNHSIGIQKAGKIIAINNDPNAEIFKTADLGFVGDCVAIAEALIDLAETR
jgi:electron transfer flavoprotein alpha subunit